MPTPSAANGEQYRPVVLRVGARNAPKLRKMGRAQREFEAHHADIGHKLLTFVVDLPNAALDTAR